MGESTCKSLKGDVLATTSEICQYTPIGVYCPPNFYCPNYIYEEVFMFKDVLDKAKCSYGLSVAQITGNFSYIVMCPCSPGFVCAGDTLVPTFCPPGYYCPPNPNTTVTPFGQKIGTDGLGSFGSVVEVCPEGSFCTTGLVVPFICDLRLMDCPAGTVHPNTWKLVFIIFFFMLLVYLPLHARFLWARVLRAKKLRRWEAHREELKSRLRDNLREELQGRETLAVLNNKRTVRELRESLGMAPLGGAGLDDIPPPSEARFSKFSINLGSFLGRSSSVTPDSLGETGIASVENPLPTKSGLPATPPTGSNGAEMRQLATTANANANVDAETTGVNIRFDDICWTAPNGKTIMYKVSGEFRAGRMTAIMGPSGAGKSTIIALITGKSKRNSGSVTVNGAEVATLGDHPECTGKVGFVPQEDVMLRDLSASENIAFSARYRLPPSLSAAEVEEKINETIDVLELEKVRDDIVGDERIRGISGGQRKRVNVGIELVTEPKVLFLDEPTSGLDSTKSRRLCKILQEVTRRRNMTVAAVIHQPSREAFEMFDDLLLLGAGGSVMYYGEIKGMSGPEMYFARLGFVISPGTNPAEFYLDVAQGEIEHADMPPALNGMKDKKCYLLNEWNDKRDWPKEKRWAALAEGERLLLPATSVSRKTLEGDASKVGMSSSTSGNGSDVGYRVSDAEFERIQLEIMADESIKDMVAKLCFEIAEHFSLICHDMKAVCEYKEWPTVLKSCSWQFYLCLRRSWRYYREERALSLYAECFMNSISGLIVSVAAQHLKFVGPMPTPVCVIQALPLQPRCFIPQESNFTLIGTFLCFGSLFTAIAASSQIFSTEQPNYWRECSAGLKTVPYFLGHVVGNLPRMFLSATLFWLSFTFYYRDTGPGSGLWLVVLGLYAFGYSLGYFVSQLAAPQYTALLGVLCALLFAVLFSGVLPVFADVLKFPTWMQFPWETSGPRWAIEAFYVNAISIYATIPKSRYNDLYVGAPWVDIEGVVKQVGYKADNFGADVAAILWDSICWMLVALVLMYALHRPKTR